MVAPKPRTTIVRAKTRNDRDQGRGLIRASGQCAAPKGRHDRSRPSRSQRTACQPGPSHMGDHDQANTSARRCSPGRRAKGDRNHFRMASERDVMKTWSPPKRQPVNHERKARNDRTKAVDFIRASGQCAAPKADMAADQAAHNAKNRLPTGAVHIGRS